MNLAEFNFKISQNQSFVLANDAQFLGSLNLNRYDSESIVNPYGNYGSHYSSTSIFNKYSNYGSPYSSLSPFNPYSSTPPKIYLRGHFYGYLSKNKYIGIKTIDPDELISWMEFNNLRY